jgi:hypothetical protein
MLFIKFFSKSMVVSAFYTFLVVHLKIRSRIHKVTETGSNPDPDPQPWFLFTYGNFIIVARIRRRGGGYPQFGP